MTDEALRHLLGEVPLKRPDYPHLDDPDHPLWDAQQAGWPDHARHEAWAAVVRVNRDRAAPHGDSASHPAYDPAYIRNGQATRPEEDESARVATGTGKERARR